MSLFRILSVLGAQELHNLVEVLVHDVLAFLLVGVILLVDFLSVYSD